MHLRSWSMELRHPSESRPTDAWWSPNFHNQAARMASEVRPDPLRSQSPSLPPGGPELRVDADRRACSAGRPPVNSSRSHSSPSLWQQRALPGGRSTCRGAIESYPGGVVPPLQFVSFYRLFNNRSASRDASIPGYSSTSSSSRAIASPRRFSRRRISAVRNRAMVIQ